MLPDGVLQRHPVERAGVRGGAILRRRVTKPPAHRRFADTPSSRRPRCMRYRGQQEDVIAADAEGDHSALTSQDQRSREKRLEILASLAMEPSQILA